MTNYHFSNFCKNSGVGIIETTNMINDTQRNTSSNIPLNIPSRKPTQNTETKFFEIEFLLQTGANICILYTQIWTSIKTYLSPSKHELKQDVDTKLRTASSQLLPPEGIVKLTLNPFRDHHATLTTTFAIADTKYNIPGLSLLQTWCTTIDTEFSSLFLSIKQFLSGKNIFHKFVKNNHRFTQKLSI